MYNTKNLKFSPIWKRLRYSESASLCEQKFEEFAIEDFIHEFVLTF